MKSKQYRKAVWLCAVVALLSLLAGFTLPKSIAVRSLLGDYKFLDSFSLYATSIAREVLRIDSCTMLSRHLDKEEEGAGTGKQFFSCVVFPSFISKFSGPRAILVFVDREDGAVGIALSLKDAILGTRFVEYRITRITRFAQLDRRAAQMDVAVEQLSWLAMPFGSKDQPVKMYYQAHLANKTVSYEMVFFGSVLLMSLAALWCLYRNVRYVRTQKEQLATAAQGIVNVGARSPILALIDDLGLTTSDFEVEVAEIVDVIRVMKEKDDADAQQMERLQRAEAERRAEEAQAARHFATELEEFSDRLIKASFPDGVYRKIMAHVRNAAREEYDLPTRRSSLGTATRLFENATRQRSLIERLEMVRRDVPLQMTSHSAYADFVKHLGQAREGLGDYDYRSSGVDYSLEQARRAADVLKVSVPITA